MASANGDAASQPNGHASSPLEPPAPPAAPLSQPTSAALPTNPAVPLTSAQDNGLSKRPRDARLIHMLLSALGVSAYQERVPLQLLDFAYRHSSAILSDALHLSSDAYVSQQTRARDAPPGGGFKDADGQVSMAAVRLAIASRLQYQFNGGEGGGLSKDFLLECAAERNKTGLPRVPATEWGVRLPSERFVLTGIPWGLKEWEEDGGEELDPEASAMDMDGMEEEEGMEGVEDGNSRMEDLFGGDGADDEDAEME